MNVPAIRRYIAARRAREQIFGENLFADPVWDILLDLFVHENTGRRVSISSMCIAAAVPATTALRHIATLCERGIIRRVAVPNDGRRFDLQFTADGRDMMRRYFASIDDMALDPIEFTAERPEIVELERLRGIVERIQRMVA